MSASSAARVAFIIETSIGMCSKHHVASSVPDAIMGIGGDVIKELMDGSRGGFSGSGLLTTDGAESNKKFVVDCMAILEEGSTTP